MIRGRTSARVRSAGRPVRPPCPTDSRAVRSRLTAKVVPFSRASCVGQFRSGSLVSCTRARPRRRCSYDGRVPHDRCCRVRSGVLAASIEIAGRAARDRVFVAPRRVTAVGLSPLSDRSRRRPQCRRPRMRDALGGVSGRHVGDALRRGGWTRFYALIGGLREAQFAWCSSCAATDNRRSSRPCRATSWIPMGSPSLLSCNGSEIAG